MLRIKTYPSELIAAAAAAAAAGGGSRGSRCTWRARFCDLASDVEWWLSVVPLNTVNWDHRV